MKNKKLIKEFEQTDKMSEANENFWVDEMLQDSKVNRALSLFEDASQDLVNAITAGGNYGYSDAVKLMKYFVEEWYGSGGETGGMSDGIDEEVKKMQERAGITKKEEEK